MESPTHVVAIDLRTYGRTRVEPVLGTFRDVGIRIGHTTSLTPHPIL